MTRILTIVVILVAAAFVALIAWPRSDSRSNSPVQTGSQLPSQTGAESSQSSSFTVLVEGRELQDRQESVGLRMADQPASSWNSSMISNIRSIGSSQVLVFVDGSEAIIDSFTLDRLPQDVAFRAGYSRE